MMRRPPRVLRHGERCRPAGRRTAFLLALSLPFLVAACQDDELIPMAPISPGIVGRVLVAGSALRATIEVELAEATGPLPGFEAEQKTDERGQYRFVLPAGRYLVCAHLSGDPFESWAGDWYYHREGLVEKPAEAETLVVTAAGPAVTADFRLGRIDAELFLAPDFNGSSVRVYAYRRRSDGSWDSDAHASHLWRLGGTHLLAGLPVIAGTYRLSVEAGARTGVIWAPGVPTEAQARTLVVDADDAILCSVRLTTGPAILRLSLRGDGWGPFEDRWGHLTAFDDDSLEVARGGAPTGDEGEIVGSFSRPVRLLAQDRGSPAFWVGGLTFERATRFDMIADSAVLVPPITTGGLRLHWTGPEATAEKYAWLRLETEEGVALPPRRLNLNGDLATVHMFPPGRYRLRIDPSMPGWVPWTGQWFDQAERPEDATLIEIPEHGPLVPIELRMQAGGTIQGTVIAPDYALAVYGTRPDDPRACWIGPADPRAGRFALVGLENGDYKIGLGWDPCCAGTCPMPPASTCWYGGASWDSAAVVTIRDHVTVEGIELVWR